MLAAVAHEIAHGIQYKRGIDTQRTEHTLKAFEAQADLIAQAMLADAGYPQAFGASQAASLCLHDDPQR